MKKPVHMTDKQSVKLWNDSWFKLLYALRHPKTVVHSSLTELVDVRCPVDAAHPHGLRKVPKKRRSNFKAIIDEIEKQVGMSGMVKAAYTDDKELVDEKEVELVY